MYVLQFLFSLFPKYSKDSGLVLVEGTYSVYHTSQKARIWALTYFPKTKYILTILSEHANVSQILLLSAKRCIT